MRLTVLLMVVFSALSAWSAPAIRGLRVDPSYFYNLYPGQSASQVAAQVVAKAQAANVNTLFLYAYNSTYGAFYKTTYSMTSVEGGYGSQDIFGLILAAAKAKGMSVVANMPMNDFKKVWVNQPAWRSKKKTGYDYIPESGIHLLSAWHPGFRQWLSGFYADFLARYPGVDAIEAVEPMVDYYWNKASDYNPESNAEFNRRYPGALLGSATWLKFRAQGLTDLIAIMAQRAHAVGKKATVVQTWSVGSTGSLYSSANLRDGMGFDFDSILNLTGTSKLDYIMAEFMWQQWKSEYGTSVFTPAWTRSAAQSFISFVGTRSIPLIHLEISPFSGAAGDVVPTANDLYSSIQAVSDIAPGIDLYDQAQLQTMNAWWALSPWN